MSGYPLEETQPVVWRSRAAESRDAGRSILRYVRLGLCPVLQLREYLDLAEDLERRAQRYEALAESAEVTLAKARAG